MPRRKRHASLSQGQSAIHYSTAIALLIANASVLMLGVVFSLLMSGSMADLETTGKRSVSQKSVAQETLISELPGITEYQGIYAYGYQRGFIDGLSLERFETDIEGLPAIDIPRLTRSEWNAAYWGGRESMLSIDDNAFRYGYFKGFTDSIAARLAGMTYENAVADVAPPVLARNEIDLLQGDIKSNLDAVNYVYTSKVYSDFAINIYFGQNTETSIGTIVESRPDSPPVSDPSSPLSSDTCSPPCVPPAICFMGACITPQVCNPPCPPGWACVNGRCEDWIAGCDGGCPDGKCCKNNACTSCDKFDQCKYCNGSICCAPKSCVAGRCVLNPIKCDFHLDDNTILSWRLKQNECSITLIFRF